MNRINNFTVFLLFISALSAQVPSDWSVNPHDYEYYATLTTEVKIDNELKNKTGILAAFHDIDAKTCCGLVEAMNVNGRTIYFLMMYSNTPDQKIYFRFYYSEKDTVLPIRETLIFSSGKSYGNVDSPYRLSISAYLSINAIPEHLLYLNNYPNPFNGNLLIDFKLPNKTNAEITIYSLQGLLIRHWNTPMHSSGSRIIWDGKSNKGQDVASGNYIIILKSGDKQISKKISYLK